MHDLACKIHGATSGGVTLFFLMHCAEIVPGQQPCVQVSVSFVGIFVASSSTACESNHSAGKMPAPNTRKLAAVFALEAQDETAAQSAIFRACFPKYRGACVDATCFTHCSLFQRSGREGGASACVPGLCRWRVGVVQKL